MCKVIKFPRPAPEYTMEDYIAITCKISDLRLEIELIDGYAEYYKDIKTDKEYEQDKEEVKKALRELQQLEEKLAEMEKTII